MKNKIMEFIKKQGFNIESEEITDNSIAFYFRNNNKRYFIKIKEK